MVTERRAALRGRPGDHPGRRCRAPGRAAPVVGVDGALASYRGHVAGPLAPERTPDTTVDEQYDVDRPWVTIVWNDPINLMTYVTYVLRELFGYDEPTATKLMLQVHHDGKAIVSSGPQERMEHDTSRLHAYGLWATYQRDS